ncbi:PTS sugar transporter subunit IIB [Levilactobacillus namurensis]|uniref:PTS sugar transporter subunit IIB n=1 Tax=Levilactobacillus namurensis TaxID=380393 RepID=UPI002231294A|nr:PTS sugar transporter subunit IIB [Levilactobacillus namurensis]MCW3779210.1 PTS sugar transporter subunit IIB [Levilactobacillus namurensis]MDT7019953.1 PTS sugar transporter subunit IIB [Levilactobacillus namurensis]WNN65469.1 PTS sugar transporter subunit IIB [Levilactobacillus namurensis]
MKIAAVCQSGLGSSFMIQMNIDAVLKDENVNTDDIEVTHFDTGGLNSSAADYFFLGSDLADQASDLPQERVYVLDSIIDKKELREKLNALLDKESIKHD